jgi:hypothetical protein
MCVSRRVCVCWGGGQHSHQAVAYTEDTEGECWQQLCKWIHTQAGLRGSRYVILIVTGRHFTQPDCCMWLV